MRKCSSNKYVYCTSEIPKSAGTLSRQTICPRIAHDLPGRLRGKPVQKLCAVSALAHLQSGEKQSIKELH